MIFLISLHGQFGGVKMFGMYEHFARELSAARLGKGWSKYRLAKEAGISEAFAGRLEAGKVLPSSVTIERLAVVLGCDYSALRNAADRDRLGSEAVDRIIAHAESERQKTPKLSQDHDFSHSSDTFRSGKQGSVNDQALNSDLAPLERPDVKMIGKHELLPIEGYGRLPVFPVACGEPVLIPDYPDEWITLPSFITNGADAALRVRGESMLGAGVMPGDYVIAVLLDGAKPTPGKKVIAEIDGGATCKVYQEVNGQGVLMSQPGDGQPQLIPITSSVRIVAQVKGRYVLE